MSTDDTGELAPSLVEQVPALLAELEGVQGRATLPATWVALGDVLQELCRYQTFKCPFAWRTGLGFVEDQVVYVFCCELSEPRNEGKYPAVALQKSHRSQV